MWASFLLLSLPGGSPNQKSSVSGGLTNLLWATGIARWSQPGYSLLFHNIQPVSIMKISEYTKARLAVSFFFAASTIFYAILLSRMPALKSQVGADEAEVGLIILSMGLCGFAALLGSARALRCFGSGRLCRWSAALMVVSLLVAMFAVNVWQLAIGVGIFGFFMGMLDACVNTQGMLIEKHFSRPSMSFLHAFYGFGIFLGSASGSVFSSLSLSPLPNVAFFAALFFLLFLPACRSLQHEDEPQAGRGGTKESGRIPLFVIGCGLGYLLIEAVEGSSGDWGSLYLFSVKGADEKTAALAYGAYGSAAAVCRLFGDRMRARFGDRTLSVAGSAIAFCGLAVTLFAGNPLICLAGYAILGAGISPVGPIFFSQAGRCPGVSLERASSAVSVLAYSSLLLFPPLLGGIAKLVGLATALLLPFVLCFALIPWTFFLLKGRR